VIAFLVSNYVQLWSLSIFKFITKNLCPIAHPKVQSYLPIFAAKFLPILYNFFLWNMRSVLNRTVVNHIKNGYIINICMVLKCRWWKNSTLPKAIYDSGLPGIHIQQYAYHIKCISYVYDSIISVLLSTETEQSSIFSIDQAFIIFGFFLQIKHRVSFLLVRVSNGRKV